LISLAGSDKHPQSNGNCGAAAPGVKRMCKFFTIFPLFGFIADETDTLFVESKGVPDSGVDFADGRLPAIWISK
jgi:hypothetical protein